MEEDDAFHNYKELEREFVQMPLWIVIIKAIVFLGIIVAYIFVKGNELMYAMYLPFDLILECVLLIFRKFERYMD